MIFPFSLKSFFHPIKSTIVTCSCSCYFYLFIYFSICFFKTVTFACHDFYYCLFSAVHWGLIVCNYLMTFIFLLQLIKVYIWSYTSLRFKKKRNIEEGESKNKREINMWTAQWRNRSSNLFSHFAITGLVISLSIFISLYEWSQMCLILFVMECIIIYWHLYAWNFNKGSYPKFLSILVWSYIWSVWLAYLNRIRQNIVMH